MIKIRHVRDKHRGVNFIDVMLKGYEDSPFGWVWGEDGFEKKPLVSITVFGLTIIEIDISVGYYQLLGFWWLKP